MKRTQSMDEILTSWTRCMKAGLANSAAASMTYVNENALETALQESKLLVSLFESLGKEFDDLAIQNRSVFLLINSEGLLLKKKCSGEQNKKTELSAIKAGMSFVEGTCGTNAIALSIKLKKPVYTMPIHHYCDFLKCFYLYTVPLNVNGTAVGYLAVCSLNKAIKTELMVIIELTAYKIVQEFKTKEMSLTLPVGNELRFNERQLDILKLLAMGLPDKIIALEKGITLNTVKYHKKNIFKKLGVECSVQAIIKCLKLNVLSIDEIN